MWRVVDERPETDKVVLDTGKAAWLEVLNIERACYLQQFEKGTLGSEAFAVLEVRRSHGRDPAAGPFGSSSRAFVCLAPTRCLLLTQLSVDLVTCLRRASWQS